jgi:FkbM family methyltransferase
VTRLFYERGWHGIDVEPLPFDAAALRQERPRDTVIQAAISDNSNGAQLLHYDGPDGGATLERNVASLRARPGEPILVDEVRTMTLAQLFNEHVGRRRTVHFLKIDAEGHEERILRAGDWESYRPLVLVIEATRPHTRTPSHHDWEPLLTAVGYAFAAFDGVNRFYARDDRSDLVKLLAAPCDGITMQRKRIEAPNQNRRPIVP